MSVQRDMRIVLHKFQYVVLFVLFETSHVRVQKLGGYTLSARGMMPDGLKIWECDSESHQDNLVHRSLVNRREHYSCTAR